MGKHDKTAKADAAWALSQLNEARSEIARALDCRDPSVGEGTAVALRAALRLIDAGLVNESPERQELFLQVARAAIGNLHN